MDSRPLAVIHADVRIGWHAGGADRLAAGFRRLGIPYEVTSDRSRQGGLPVLLGTTSWTGIEQDGGDFVLVDRCQYGDKNEWVSLGWNGRGRHADYRVPTGYDGSRWRAYSVPLRDWQPAPQSLLCGQIPHPLTWYAEMAPHCRAFRPHPADRMNPTSLPNDGSFDGYKAVTLSSSVANSAVMDGIPAVAMSTQSMAWDVTAHAPQDTWTGDREDWCHWLAWCQWSWTEIADGIPHIWALR